jgi:hypothetical protein
MKCVSILRVLMLCAAPALLSAQRADAPRAMSAAERAVRQQDSVRIHGQLHADTIELRRTYADDFIGIGPTGVVRNKSQVIGDFTAHTLTFQSIATSEVVVRIYGNTAVETGVSTMVGRDLGKDVPRDNRFTRVWVLLEGRWQLVLNQYSTLVAQSR